MDLIATKRLRYGGKWYQPGETFTATKRYGSIYVAIKKADVAPEKQPVQEPVPVPTPQLSSTPAAESRAEAPTEPADEPSRVESETADVVSDVAPRAPVRRRAPQRRDMTATDGME